MTVTVVLDAAAMWPPEGTSRGTVVVLPGRGEHPGVYRRLGQRLSFDGYTVVATDPRGGEPTTAELAARTGCPVHRRLLDADPMFGWGALSGGAGTVPDALPALPTLLLHGEADPVAPIEPVRALAEAHPDATLVAVAGGVHDVLNDRFHRSVAARLVLFAEEVGKAAVLHDERGSAAPAGSVDVDPAASPARTDRPARARRAAPLHVSARLDYALRAVGQLAVPAPTRCAASRSPAPEGSR
ncbi:MAG TPA: alpha/beta hydrolase [Pseudonocardia sp.]